MGYYAKIENGIVVQVIVCGEKGIKKYSGKWIEGSMDGSIRKNPVGIGKIYDENKDEFRSKQPYDSWVLDENSKWQPPIPRPINKKNYNWNEESKEWNVPTGN